LEVCGAAMITHFFTSGFLPSDFQPAKNKIRFEIPRKKFLNTGVSKKV